VKKRTLVLVEIKEKRRYANVGGNTELDNKQEKVIRVTQ